MQAFEAGVARVSSGAARRRAHLKAHEDPLSRSDAYLDPIFLAVSLNSEWPISNILS